MRPALFTRLALAAALAALPAVASAVPVITGTSAAKTSANTGATLRVYCDDCGYATDRVHFPTLGAPNFVTPTAFSVNNWVDVRVPATWSGTIRLQKQGVGTMSNAWNHDISFSWSASRWFDLPFTWVLNNAGAPGVGFNATRDALVAGYNAWTCASGVSATFGGGTALASGGDDGVNCRFWRNTGWSPSVIAVTTWTYVIATGEIVDADIAFNSQHFAWSATGAPGAMDVGHIGTHEEGHSIGLLDLYGDADDQETMYGYSANGQTSSRTLRSDDVLGAEFMYPHTRPNLRADGAPPGWYAGVTPRNTPDATPTFAPLATMLSPTSTYVNVAMWNDGGDCAAPSGANDVLLDEELAFGVVWAGVWGAGEVAGDWRNVPLDLSGGRHTLSHVLDVVDETLESNESDNRSDFQYVWMPELVADQAVAVHPAPPDPGGGLYDNCLGVRGTGHWWGSLAVMPQSMSDDYDIQLYFDYSGNSLIGFQTPLASSFWGAGQSDFVIWNGNVVGEGSDRHGGITRFSAPTAGSAYVNRSNEVGSMVPGTVYGTRVSSPVTSLAASQIIKLHEVYLGSTATTYAFDLENLSGTADLNLSLYEAGTAYFRKSDWVVAGVTTGGGTDERFSYKPPAAGYYVVAVWKRNANDLPRANTYQLHVGPALSNLTAEFVNPGDTGPNVARTTPWVGGPLTVSATLPGEASCHLYYMNRFEGPNPITAYQVVMRVDDDWIATGGTSHPSPSPLTTVWHVPPAVVTIPGGRHTLSQSVDDFDDVAESDETDNLSSNQYVWDPAAVLDRSPLTLSRPPVPESGIQPNSNGRRYNRAATFAWVSGLAPSAPLDDYDLLIYDDYASSTAGFSNLRKASSMGSNATDFVVGSYSSSPNVLYPAVVREAILGGGLDYRLDHNNDEGRFGNSGLRNWPNQALAAGRLVDVYSVALDPGAAIDFFLRRETGADDIAFAVFPPTEGGVFARSEAIGNSLAWGSARDTLQFSATAAGWYPVVVYRTDGTGAGSALTYTFGWGGSHTVDAPAPGAPASLAFSGPFPNPARSGSRFTIALPREGQVSLELYDLGGRKVSTLADGVFAAGVHEVRLNPRGLTAGLYWARLRTEGRTLTRRLTVLAEF